MKVRFLLWDWTEVSSSAKNTMTVEMAFLSEVLREVYNGKSAPCVVEVATGGDSGTAVVCSEQIDAAKAQEIYDHFKRCGDRTTPYNRVREYKD